jgi:hypothetical protein
MSGRRPDTSGAFLRTRVWRPMLGWLDRWPAAWRFPRWRDQLRNRIAMAAERVPELRGHASAVEQAFVTVGAALTEQTRLAQELTEQGQRLSSFTAESAAENPVRATIEFVGSLLQQLDRFQHDTRELTEQLTEQHTTIAHVRSGGERLERAIAPLRIVDTLFRIEAAGLSEETRTAFAALTHDIAQLDVKVRETFAQHFEALGATRQAIGQVLEHFSAQRSEQEKIAANERAAMRESLGALDREIAGLTEHNVRTAELVRRIEQETSGIVVSVQYQDITRQKLEHVITALESLASRVEGRSASESAALVEQAARLEAMQLRAIDADVGEAADSIGDGLRKVVAHLRDIEGECLNSMEARRSSDRVAFAFDTLSGLLAALREPMLRAEQNANAAANAVKSFGGLTADLGATIRELTWGIRLIALNAQVQAAQVQHCDGLEVLARHTYVVSEETAQCADVIGHELTSLAHRLNAIVSKTETFARETSATRAEVERETRRLGAALQEQGAVVLDALRQFPLLVRRTSAFASELLDDAVLAAVDRAPLLAAAAECDELAAWSAARASAKGRATARSEIATVRDTYTMASEREVHDAMLSGARQSEPEPEAEAVGPATRGDLGGNVELF